MKKSLLKLLMFSILPFLFIGYAVYITGKESGNFYKRFTSPQQNSFILGSSRAASVNPEIIDKIIHQKFPSVRMYNYAFTWAHSPYGPKYLESIEKKIIPNTKNGFFIVTVEPTALMVDKDKPDKPEYYFENNKSVAKTSMVSTNPNIEYLLESYDFSITSEINDKIKPQKDVIAKTLILNNGRVETKIIKPYTIEKVKEMNIVKMQEFDHRLGELKVSENRLTYLLKTIDFLKQHGRVIVVRMPINKIAYSIENKWVSDFDKRIMKICLKENVPYINYNNMANNYKWSDEVHLEYKSINEFSKDLAKDILSHN